MPISRRSLLSRGTTFLTGVVLLPVAGFSAASTPARLTASVPLSAADELVLQWVRGYASAVRFAGSGVVGKLRGSEFPATHLLARIDHVALLPAALTGQLPFGGAKVFSHGDTFTFTFAGTEFTIENLLPDAFAAAVAARSARAATNLATDGVTWDPATHTLSDPFHATGVKTLKLVNPGANVVAVFATLLRSREESEAANIEVDVSFAAYWRRVLGRTSLTVAEAGGIGRGLIQQLPELAERRTADEIASLLLTPLVASSLRRALRLVAPAVVAQFASLRASTPATVSDAGVWLAILLAPQLRLGTAGVFASGLEPEKQGRFYAAVVEAAEII
jgi:hypothetical protein